MATNELRKRANWQTLSGKRALKAEEIFQHAMQTALDAVYPNLFFVEKHPKDFSDIYSTYPLAKKLLKQSIMLTFLKKNQMDSQNIAGE